MRRWSFSVVKLVVYAALFELTSILIRIKGLQDAQEGIFLLGAVWATGMGALSCMAKRERYLVDRYDALAHGLVIAHGLLECWVPVYYTQRSMLTLVVSLGLAVGCYREYALRQEEPEHEDLDTAPRVPVPSRTTVESHAAEEVVNACVLSEGAGLDDQVTPDDIHDFANSVTFAGRHQVMAFPSPIP